MEHIVTVAFPPFSPTVRVSDSNFAFLDTFLTLHAVRVEHWGGVTSTDVATDGLVEICLVHKKFLV